VTTQDTADTDRVAVDTGQQVDVALLAD